MGPLVTDSPPTLLPLSSCESPVDHDVKQGLVEQEPFCEDGGHDKRPEHAQKQFIL